jgi:predicted ATPase
MRSEEVGQRHPLTRLLVNLRSAGQLTEIDLGPLGRAETAELGMCAAGRGLEPDEARHLFEETEGQPLFVIETVRAGLAESDEEADGVTLQANGVDAHVGASTVPSRLPPRVHAVISARLAHLSDSAREIVGLAATIGRAFSLEVLIEELNGETRCFLG